MSKSESLKIEYLPVDALTPYEKNARRHAQLDVEAIAASIREFGFDDPIGIWGEKNIIVEGHGRLLAAKSLGMETVPVIRLDHLTDEQRRAYALAHNKTAELSMWDEKQLKLELEKISELDMSAFGFMDPNATDEVVEDDYEVVLPEVPKAKLGEIYKLGEHRLICGDATDPAVMSILTGRDMMNCVCTDPPYNMNYRGAGSRGHKHERAQIKNDNMPEKEFQEFLQKTFTAMASVMEDGAACYVFYKELGQGAFLQNMARGGLRFRQELVWVKNQIVLGGADYQNMYEPCLYGSKGRKPKWYGGRKSRSVIESIDLMNEDDLRKAIRELTEQECCDVVRENKPVKSDLHPTMKPIRLLAKLIKNSTVEGDAVLDMFGGSGSTLMACEQLGRRCFMSELDPKYVDVIIDRWEQFTGKKAVCL